MTPQLNALLSTIGWTLVHFVWQGAAIALVIAAVLAGSRARSSSSQARHASRASALPRFSRHRLRPPSSCVHRPRRRSWPTRRRPRHLRPTTSVLAAAVPRHGGSRRRLREHRQWWNHGCRSSSGSGCQASCCCSPGLPVHRGRYASSARPLFTRPYLDGRRQVSVWPSAFASLWHSASSNQLSSTCRA